VLAASPKGTVDWLSMLLLLLDPLCWFGVLLPAAVVTAAVWWFSTLPPLLTTIFAGTSTGAVDATGSECAPPLLPCRAVGGATLSPMTAVWVGALIPRRSGDGAAASDTDESDSPNEAVADLIKSCIEIPGEETVPPLPAPTRCFLYALPPALSETPSL
jgi:hypothetical protein